jgi:hypothetical protein
MNESKGNKGTWIQFLQILYVFILGYGTQGKKDRELSEKHKFLSEPNIVITHSNDSVMSGV